MKPQMLSVWTLLSTAICAVSVSALPQRILFHGQQLTLDLPERTRSLEFLNANETERLTIWNQASNSVRASKGYVTSMGKDWTFRIQRVTFDDEGTYTLLNHFGATIISYIVKVNSNKGIIDCVAGDTLRISLAGLKQTDATLRFYNNYSSLVLVENGVAVGRSYPDYVNRLRVSSEMIQILNVNVSDVGRYELTDLKRRLVSNNTMILVDHRDYSANKGLLALLLLGIPGGICFCCRKRICKCCQTTKSDTSQPNSVPMSSPSSNTMSGPVGPGDNGQGYIAGYPSQPDPGQNHYPYQPESGGQPAVPPNPGYVAGYPSHPYPPESGGQPAAPPNPGFYQNPVYPPASGPAPAQPPQWNAPPTNYQPPAPVNYAPVMSSAPSGPEMPPTVPLLTPQPQSQPMDILNSSESGFQFDVNKGRSPGNNFL